jgi:hypothetical protein
MDFPARGCAGLQSISTYALIVNAKLTSFVLGGARADVSWPQYMTASQELDDFNVGMCPSKSLCFPHSGVTEISTV